MSVITKNPRWGSCVVFVVDDAPMELISLGPILSMEV